MILNYINSISWQNRWGEIALCRNDKNTLSQRNCQRRHCEKQLQTIQGVPASVRLLRTAMTLFPLLRLIYQLIPPPPNIQNIYRRVFLQVPP